ncbi:siderophore-interacting protein [Acinetobacter larvae]|uniref:FAD-binding FR-type domain-containing protein n=1 Tax=Acinetobacter larvae TaxID=1789224 RepID=A0A1B2M172_9GAMM|nr:SIP domain-containing protein [Acinetobacter larvae]AOA58925.1 hypothetical protein BFG52_11560 [Acinetobacter larvae]
MFVDQTKQHIQCIVLSAITITPHMRRVVLGGPELSAWLSNPQVQVPAAWVKIFPPGIKGRAYTIRSIDYQKSTICIDFVMHSKEHEKNTVSAWASFCQPGDCVEIAGPRSGGFNLQSDTEWLWIAADLTALPAAINIIESLAADFPVTAFFVIDSLLDKQEIDTVAKLQARWRTLAIRPDTGAMRNHIMKDIKALPQGNGQVWIAGEARWSKGWRDFWLDHQQLPASRMSSKGYWKLGEQDYRD